MGYDAFNLSLLGYNRTTGSSDIDHFVAETPSQKEAIYRFRYDAYAKCDLIRQSLSASLSDWQDDEPDTVIYGINLQGRLAGTIRLTPLRADQKACATYEMFGDALDPILEAGGTIADGSRLAVACEDPKTRRRVLMYALGIAMDFARHHCASHGAIIARHRHAPFYERYGFQSISGPFDYAEALTPLCLMIAPLPHAVGAVPARSRYDSNVAMSAA
ncbi:N-acyl amino acid synthase FeeM domain-containing protein [Palleronia sp. LCG004]|uniref:N-acyl amino acid synthase FeeM domain-containing protein n=1 Tax=Palleronia sp. LCG004 TaxID=3079304 RepID=UPI0029432752|nr:hypothetical protein [Palleronia sp. LCG004]WOI58334.1 hypothetical protein RVY76_17640 [Palleronia sp. LCG004]